MTTKPTTKKTIKATKTPKPRKQRELSPLSKNLEEARKLLERKRGASVEELTSRFDVTERNARAMIGRLRMKGVDVKLLEKGRWNIEKSGGASA